MTLTTTANTVQATGDGSTTGFSFPYLVYQESHLTITIDDVATTAWSAATYGDSAGVTVTFDSAPADQSAIVIQRIVPLDQQTDFQNFDGNPADVTEKQFDLNVMQVQQVDEALDRAVTFPVGSGISSFEVTGTADTSSQFMIVTTSGISLGTPTTISFDTVLSSLASGDLLKYNGTNWVNVTQASLGLLTDVVSDTTPQLGGFLDPNSNYIGMDKGGDIASATTLVIDTDGDYFDITGTTTITGMTVAANRFFILQFDGALTLTHGASLDLPGSANITTAAGDHAVFYSTAADTVKCISYTKNDGTAISGGSAGMTLISTATASSSTSIDFTSGIDSTYEEYELHIIDLVPATDGSNPLFRTSTNAGVSFDSGASDYGYAFDGRNDAGTALTSQSTGSTSIPLGDNVGSAAGESYNAVIKIFNPAGTNNTMILFRAESLNNSGVYQMWVGGGHRKSAADVDAIRFLMSSGNIASGEFKLYGIKKS